MNPVTVDDFQRDYFFRVKHPTLAWNTCEVLVRDAGPFWQYSFGYQFMSVGTGGPFEGRAPSREAAGRIGLVRLRNALLQLAGDRELTDRDADQKAAAAHAARIDALLHPPAPAQLELAFA